MKWINGETWHSEKNRLQQWHKWFAWYPVKIGETYIEAENKTRDVMVWLCHVERRGEYTPCSGGDSWEWHYMEIK